MNKINLFCCISATAQLISTHRVLLKEKLSERNIGHQLPFTFQTFTTSPKNQPKTVSLPHTAPSLPPLPWHTPLWAQAAQLKV